MKLFLVLMLLVAACGSDQKADLLAECNAICPGAGAGNVAAYPPAQCQCFCDEPTGAANFVFDPVVPARDDAYRAQWEYAQAHGCRLF